MSDRTLDESVHLKTVSEPMPEAMIVEGGETKPTELKPPPEEFDLPPMESVHLNIVPEPRPEAMFEEEDQAKPTELKLLPVEFDLTALPMPEAMVKVEEEAKYQAEAVVDDIPVVANFETFSMEGIPPNIEMRGPTELLPPKKNYLPAVGDDNVDVLFGDVKATIIREMIDEIFNQVEKKINMCTFIRAIHSTDVVPNMKITEQILRLGVPGPSMSSLPVYQFGQFAKTLENIVSEGLQEKPKEESDNKPKVDDEDTGMEEEKDAEQDQKEKPEKEPEEYSKN